MSRLLLISRDPGGTNQLAALRDILLGPACTIRDKLYGFLELSTVPEIEILAKEFAGPIWRQYDIEPMLWPHLSDDQAVRDYLEGLKPDQIITATSHLDDRTEQQVWRAARELGLTATAFLDSVHNLALRFRDDQGEIVLPDRVSVLSPECSETLRALGMAAENIQISGDLYQQFSQRRAAQTEYLALPQWQAQKGESLILFASDYIREMQALGVSYEVTEFQCLDCLIDLLQSGKITDFIPDITSPYRLIIRPHPKDTPGKYAAYPDQSTDKLMIRISEAGRSFEAITGSHLVAGLGSSLLDEAETLGVSVLKLAPLVKSGKVNHHKGP